MLGGFLQSDELSLGSSQSLRLQQRVIQITVTSPRRSSDLMLPLINALGMEASRVVLTVPMFDLPACGQSNTEKVMKRSPRRKLTEASAGCQTEN